MLAAGDGTVPRRAASGTAPAGRPTRCSVRRGRGVANRRLGQKHWQKQSGRGGAGAARRAAVARHRRPLRCPNDAAACPRAGVPRGAPQRNPHRARIMRRPKQPRRPATGGASRPPADRSTRDLHDGSVVVCLHPHLSAGDRHAGRDMVLVMSRTLARGTRPASSRRPASASASSATPFSPRWACAILQASEWLFTALKLVGAAYLLYLGIGLLRSSGTLEVTADAGRAHSPLSTFAQGAMSNLPTPRWRSSTGLPAAVRACGRRPSDPRRLRAGPRLRVPDLLVKGPVALSAGLLSNWIRRNPRFLTGLHRTSGVVMIGLGLKLAFERRN